LFTIDSEDLERQRHKQCSPQFSDTDL